MPADEPDNFQKACRMRSGDVLPSSFQFVPHAHLTIFPISHSNPPLSYPKAGHAYTTAFFLSFCLSFLLFDHFHVFDDDFSVKVLDADFSVLDFDHEDSVGVGDGDAIISDGHLLVDAVVLDPRVAFRDLDDIHSLDVFDEDGAFVLHLHLLAVLESRDLVTLLVLDAHVAANRHRRRRRRRRFRLRRRGSGGKGLSLI